MASIDDTDRTGLIGIAHLLVLLQGAVLVTATIESLVFLGFAGPGGVVTLGVTAASAVATLAAAAGLARHARAARRLTLVCEAGILVVAALEAVLAVALVGIPAGPVVVLTRMVVPLAVIVVLRRPDVRRAFDPASGAVEGASA